MSGSAFRNGLITLDEPKAVYYSGQIILGKINFELDVPLKILQLNVAYKGAANVLWTEEQSETNSGVSRTKTIKYVGHQDFFDFTQCLSGSKGVTVLKTGVHSIPFNYQIPFTAPSSFKGEQGQVEYCIKAILIHNDGVLKEEIDKKFEVIAPFDMNTVKIKAPIEIEFEYVSGCCVGAPQSVRVRTASAGFCPGDLIAFWVHSATSVEVKQITFQVYRRLAYKSYHPRSVLCPPPDIIATMTQGPIMISREYMFEMKLPDFIAINLQNCDIIVCRYFLKVTLKTSNFNDDLVDETEIAMGLVPIGSDLDVKSTHPMADDLPIAPIPKATEAPIIDQPSYNYEVNAFPNIQICPPAPAGYPYRPYEPDINRQVDQNPTMPMFPPLPNIVPGQFVPYPPVESRIPNLPTGYAPYPPGQSDIPDIPPPPYSSVVPFSAQPSAPPPGT